MSGEELKKVLIRNGYVLKDVAEMLGTSQQNFSQALKADDVKTGLLERICNVLQKKIDFFYAESEYAPLANSMSGASEELLLLRGQVMAYQDALNRIGRGDFISK